MSAVISRRNLISGSAASLLLPHTVLARPLHGSSQASLLKLNFNFGPSWASAPASYTTALATAQTIIQNAFPLTNATINIEMGYGFFDETDLGNASPMPANNSGSGILYGTSVSYSTIRAAMAAIANPTATLTAILNNTPAGSSLNGQSAFQLPAAIAKILGIFGAGLPSSSTDVRRDGAIGMGSGWSPAKLVGVSIHEIRHTMGCVTAFAPFAFSRFTSAGARRVWPITTIRTTSAIFSTALTEPASKTPTTASVRSRQIRQFKI